MADAVAKPVSSWLPAGAHAEAVVLAARLDLSEFTENLMDGAKKPSVSLPDAGDTAEAMRTRIREFYSREQ